ncbi:MAG: DNA mismatch repair protein MutS [Phycisphaerales bacterium]
MPPTASDPRATPAMRQYFRFKAEHPGCLLFFRMGDFYEMFDEDAIAAHRALGITLTERTKGVPMAGVPHHAGENYLRRLVEQGFRVAVCEQMEDPAQAKGVVERAVMRVLTPGTLVDEALLDESRPNLLGSVVLVDEPAAGAGRRDTRPRQDHDAARDAEGGADGAADRTSGVLALAEVSTGAFTLHRLPRGRVLDELVRLAPNELLCVEGEPHALLRRFVSLHGAALTARPAWTFRTREAAEALREQFRVASLDGFGLAADDPAIGAAGALVRYLRETQAPGASEGDRARPGHGEGARGATIAGTGGAVAAAPSAPRLAHLRPPRLVETSRHLAIDATSLRSLEIERTMRTGGVDGSLLATMQRCRTPMGKRLLRQWLCFPLCEREAIESRQRCVAALVDDRPFAADLMERLGGVQDVARIAARAALGRATPRDLVALGRSTRRVTQIAEQLDGRPAFAEPLRRLAAVSSAVVPLAARIERECVEDPPPHLRDGGLFRDGADAALDEARGLQRDAGAWIAAYQRSLVAETEIASLKVGFNRVFGYYIEVTNAHAAKVPATFTRRQTLRGAERYITPELKAHEEKVLSAESRALERERTLFEALGAAVAGVVVALAELADVAATLDVLAALAEHAARHRCVRPTIVDSPRLRIVQGRHPVLDAALGERFVPNDCALRWDDASTGERAVEGTGIGRVGPDEDPTAERDGGAGPANASASLALITGPNMAGKSTFIRQTALIVLLAHIGAFVPARSATIGLCDRIFTRIGASDELHAGQSTFMVEMTETANILHHATERSLVVLDEIGRGTSTLDGLSLAWAIAETLAQRRCRALFATHYHELTGLAERLPAVANLQVAVREWNDEIVFLHRILPGRSDRSYGIHVAKLAGLPATTVRRAEQLLETLAVQTEPRAIDPTPPPRAGAQLALFTEYLPHPALERLRRIELDRLTPLQAFDVLRALHDEAGGAPARRDAAHDPTGGGTAGDGISER